MHKIFVALAVAAMAAVATPVNAASDDVHAKNLAFLTEFVSNYDSATPVEFVDGRVMTLGEALDLTAAKAGAVDLAAIISGAVATNGGTAVGDVWHLAYGTGSCTANVLAPQPMFQAPHGQLWIYAGGVGDLSATNQFYAYSIDWTTKGTTGGFYGAGAGWTATGNQDFYCFGFSGIYIAFPFVDGVVQMN